jgi:hypothetical protein
MISYVKLYGPPVYDAIKALEKIAIDMPKVCIMDSMMQTQTPDYNERLVGTSLIQGGAYDYFMELGNISKERCDNIISKSGEKLGDFDFFFEWFKKPNMNELNELIKKIDTALKPLGTKYSITTK